MAQFSLACTGDPLLDLMLAGCSSFKLRPVACETVADALREADQHLPSLIFTSLALGDLRPLLRLKQSRICCLVEGGGETPAEFPEVLAADRITPELVDAWVRRPARSEPPRPVAPPAPPEPGRPVAATARPEASRPAVAPTRPEPIRIPPPASLPGSALAPTPAVPAPAPVQPAREPARPAAPRTPPRAPLAGRQQSRPQPEPPRPALSVLRQQVVAFWGGKPGAGRSTLAVALSDLISRAGSIRVCTVDLNPYNSSLAALVGKEQEAPSWFHLSEALARGGPFPVDALRWIKSNWALVTGPQGRPDWVGQLNRESMVWLVEALRSHFDYIILDPEARPGLISETAVRLAQTVLITVSAHYPDVLDTTRAFEAGLEQGLFDRGRCRLILNRWLETPYLPASDVADCFSLPVSLIIPANNEAAVAASSQGVPVTQLDLPSARALAQAISPLVGLVAEPVAAVGQDRMGTGAPWRTWFGR